MVNNISAFYAVLIILNSKHPKTGKWNSLPPRRKKILRTPNSNP
jgi:hypothetical protein